MPCSAQTSDGVAARQSVQMNGEVIPIPRGTGSGGLRALRGLRGQAYGSPATPVPGSEGIPLSLPLPECMDTLLPTRAQDGGLARGSFQGARLQHVPLSC